MQYRLYSLLHLECYFLKTQISIEDQVLESYFENSYLVLVTASDKYGYV